jgi:hypothetical protein
MTATVDSIDSSVDSAPPIHNGDTNLKQNLRWCLARYTGQRWSVSSVTSYFEESSAEYVLSAALSHETGSLIQISPFDPEEHRHDSPQFQANRVRLRDAIRDRQRFVTVDELPDRDWTDPLKAFKTVANSELHPFPNAQDQISLHHQDDVHAEDDEILESNDGRRGYTVDPLGETIIATVGAAAVVSAQLETQSNLGAFGRN